MNLVMAKVSGSDSQLVLEMGGSTVHIPDSVLSALKHLGA